MFGIKKRNKFSTLDAINEVCALDRWCFEEYMNENRDKALKIQRIADKMMLLQQKFIGIER